MEKKIEVLITNQDYENKIVDFLTPNESPLYHAVKRALAENNINVEVLRFGTFNVNTNDAQIGKLDRSFDNDDFLMLKNQFLKKIQFQEKRILTLFDEPQKFKYPTFSIIEDDSHNTNNTYLIPTRKPKTDGGEVPSLKLACVYFMHLIGENIPMVSSGL